MLRSVTCCEDEPAHPETEGLSVGSRAANAATDGLVTNPMYTNSNIGQG